MKSKSENKEEKDKYEVRRCSECLSYNLIRDSKRGETICGDCGLVIDDNIVDFGPDWRAFDSEQRDKRARTGPPMTQTVHDRGLSTVIDWQNRDYTGQPIAPENYLQLQRIRKWHKRARVTNASERTLAIGLGELDKIASKLDLPSDTRESASLLYRKSSEEGLIKGRSIESVAAAVIYIACRQHGNPRTFKEISGVLGVNKKKIMRSYTHIKRELGIELGETSPKDYVPRFCSKLGLSGEVKAKAIELLSKVDERKLTSGREPDGVATAAIYVASAAIGEDRTQGEIADGVGVTEVMVRNRYKDLAEALEKTDDPFCQEIKKEGDKKQRMSVAT